MRIERWYWLYAFCVCSLIIHGILALSTRSVGEKETGSNTGGIEVSMVPSPDPTPEAKPDPKPDPKPIKKAEPKLKPKATAEVKNEIRAEPKRIRARIAAPLLPIPRNFASIKSSTHRSRKIVVVEKSESAPKIVPKPELKPITERKPIILPDAILSETPQIVESRVRLNVPTPRVHSNRTKSQLIPSGGSPASNALTVKGKESESPPSAKEDVQYNGGGIGGNELPQTAPRIGGGGGNSILSVKDENNPLGDIVPDEKPGSGPGTNGGRGNGSGGGVGHSKGVAIGIVETGNAALGSLRRKTGAGIGESARNTEGIGTKAPKSARGISEDLPGTGGTGLGYGRGKGIEISDTGDELPLSAKLRGAPFAEIAGLLDTPKANSEDKGRGGLGRGAVFDPKPVGGGDGAIHVVYCLDISGSMRDGNKIGKAKEAIKRALSELRQTDGFNIVLFKKTVASLSPDMEKVSADSISRANSYIDNINIGDGTNVSGAMDIAFQYNGVTHIYLISDGEPNGGINDFGELRRFIRDKNKNRVKILTLALGLGEDFPGKRLLEDIAKENNGIYSYVNLASPRGK